MFFNKPKISRTWKSDSGAGCSIEDDAGRKVVLWFDSDSEDFIKDRTGANLRVEWDFGLGLLAAQRQQAQAGPPRGGSGSVLGLAGLGSLFGRN